VADALYRLFYGTRPFDKLMLGIDVTVVVISFLGLLVGWLAWKRFGLRKRQKAIGVFIDRGSRLLSNLPYGSADTPAWTEAVESFTHDVVAYLEKKSPRAVNTFLENFEPLTFNPMVAFDIRVTHAMLAHSLKNLRSIMENAEAYF